MQSTVGAIIAETQAPAMEMAPMMSRLLKKENKFPHYQEAIANMASDDAIYSFSVERTIAGLEAMTGGV